MAAEKERIEHSLSHHTPDEADIPSIERLRTDAKKFALSLLKHCPKGREYNTAAKHVEEALMWGVKAIVCKAAAAKEP